MSNTKRRKLGTNEKIHVEFQLKINGFVYSLDYQTIKLIIRFFPSNIKTLNSFGLVSKKWREFLEICWYTIKVHKFNVCSIPSQFLENCKQLVICSEVKRKDTGTIEENTIQTSLNNNISFNSLQSNYLKDKKSPAHPKANKLISTLKELNQPLQPFRSKIPEYVPLYNFPKPSQEQRTNLETILNYQSNSKIHSQTEKMQSVDSFQPIHTPAFDQSIRFPQLEKKIVSNHFKENYNNLEEKDMRKLFDGIKKNKKLKKLSFKHCYMDTMKMFFKLCKDESISFQGIEIIVSNYGFIAERLYPSTYKETEVVELLKLPMEVLFPNIRHIKNPQFFNCKKLGNLNRVDIVLYEMDDRKRVREWKEQINSENISEINILFYFGSKTMDYPDYVTTDLIKYFLKDFTSLKELAVSFDFACKDLNQIKEGDFFPPTYNIDLKFLEDMKSVEDLILRFNHPLFNKILNSEILFPDWKTMNLKSLKIGEIDISYYSTWMNQPPFSAKLDLNFFYTENHSVLELVHPKETEDKIKDLFRIFFNKSQDFKGISIAITHQFDDFQDPAVLKLVSGDVLQLLIQDKLKEKEYVKHLIRLYEQ